MAPKTKEQLEKDEQIYQLSTLVAGAFSLQEVLDKLAEAAVKITGVKACSIRLLDQETGDLKMRSTYGLSEEYRNKGPVTKDDPVIKAAFAGQPVVLDDMRTDDRVKYKEATIEEGLVSQLTVAMLFRGKPIGALRLYSPTPKHFTRSDIRVARAVASQCAVAITNARLYSRAVEGARMAEQIRLAGLIQRKMIPEQAPRINRLDIAATYIPCFDVGGDFYDFLEISDDCILVTVADVMGKGIPAALMMSCFRSALRAYEDTEAGSRFHQFLVHSRRDILQAYADTEAGSSAIKSIIDKLNRMAYNQYGGVQFITMFYAIIDAKEKTMTYCNCGHEPTVLIRDGQTKDLDKGGLVLGVDPNADYEIETVTLKDGDCLLFYTDGLIDAANFDGQLWGRENMLDAAKQFASGTAEQMAKNILGYRRRFVGLAEQIDDTSIVIVKIDDKLQLKTSN
jgi:serine phosphatase RsbU (regulator of sigma subunit)